MTAKDLRERIEEFEGLNRRAAAMKQELELHLQDDSGQWLATFGRFGLQFNGAGRHYADEECIRLRDWLCALFPPEGPR